VYVSGARARTGTLASPAMIAGGLSFDVARDGQAAGQESLSRLSLTHASPAAAFGLDLAADAPVDVMLDDASIDIADEADVAEPPSSFVVSYASLMTSTLTVDLSGSGSGSVTSSPGGISCTGSGTTCSASFTDGTSVTLTATADTGSTFVGWGGACAGTGSTCTVTAGAVGLVVATFRAAPTYVTMFYHLDVVGSVRAVTDASGGTVESHDFWAFGEETTAATLHTRFVGKERDAETQLDYSIARYYGSKTGRFTTSDPGHVGGDLFGPQSWSAYGYGLSNPLRFVDPMGLDPEKPIFTIGGGGPPDLSEIDLYSLFEGLSGPGGQGQQGKQPSQDGGSGGGASQTPVLRAVSPAQKKQDCRTAYLEDHTNSRFLAQDAIPLLSYVRLFEDGKLALVEGSAAVAKVGAVKAAEMYGLHLFDRGWSLVAQGAPLEGAPASSYAISEGMSMASRGLTIHQVARVGGKAVGKSAGILGLFATMADIAATFACGGGGQ
jgi:RHS repeat-associated protein